MILLIITSLYIIISHLLDFTFEFFMGTYLIGLCLAKGLISEELKDVFNMQKTKYLYKKNGVGNSLLEMICLILVFINIIVIDYEPLSTFDYVYILFLIIILYRFIFWGTINTISNRN